MQFLLSCHLVHHDGGEGIRDSQERTWDTRINHYDHLDFLAPSLRFADSVKSQSQMNNAPLKEGREDSKESNGTQ